MTRREQDIFIARGLIGIVRMLRDRPPFQGYPKMAKDILVQSKDIVKIALKEAESLPVVEEYDEVDDMEFKRWLHQGLITMSEFVERLSESDPKYRKLGSQMRSIIQGLQ